MALSNPLFAICIKQDEIIKQNVGSKHVIVPGDLIKIMPVEISETSDHYDIQIYNSSKNAFDENVSYRCDKANLMQVDDHIMSFVRGLSKGDTITLNLEVCGSKANVGACIKRIGDVRNLGAGRYFTFELSDASNLTEDQKMYIQDYNTDPCGCCFIRGDRLIEYLIIDQLTTIDSIEPSMEDNQQLTINSIESTMVKDVIYHGHMEVDNQVSFTIDLPSNFTPLPSSTKISNEQAITVSEASIIDLRKNVTHSYQTPLSKSTVYSNVIAQMSSFVQNNNKQSDESEHVVIKEQNDTNDYAHVSSNLYEPDTKLAVKTDDVNNDHQSNYVSPVHNQHKCEGFTEQGGDKSSCSVCGTIKIKLFS